VGGPEYCQRANEQMITIVQIEHVDAVENLAEILAVPGLTGIVIGSNDLSGSMGYTGQPRHPEVLRTIESIIAKAQQAEPFVGIALGDDPDIHIEWMEKGVQWLVMGGDADLMLRGADYVTSRVLDHARAARQ
jgi:4-hydroxy-2-oxoheptanedioate aldolase